MPDENEGAATGDAENEDEGTNGDTGNTDDADEDAEDTEGESDADGDSNSDKVGGSGASTDSESKEDVAEKPTGKALIDLLAGDGEAQTLLTSTLQSMLQEQSRTAAAKEQAEEFQKLIKEGDYAEVGRRVIERTQTEQERERISDEVLQGVFQPVYADLLAQPEMKALTAEEKLSLDPSKYDSDAHYVRAITSFIEGKRYEAKVEAEVERRIKTRDEAEANRKTAALAGSKSSGAMPGASGPGGANRTSGDLIREGLRTLYGGNTATDGDDDDE